MRMEMLIYNDEIYFIRKTDKGYKIYKNGPRGNVYIGTAISKDTIENIIIAYFSKITEQYKII